ncbi:MAG: hypothetical protein J6K45_04805 [Clostridia bacterium]|nr:hypothetical protein [Clostridia bacterium]
MVPQCKKSKKYAYISAGITSAIVFGANTGGIVPLNNILGKSDDSLFSINDTGEIVCNFDGWVSINGSINFTYLNENNYAYIYKNEEKITNVWGKLPIVTTNFMMPISAGDKISLRYYSTEGNKVGNATNQTFFNVVKIS